MTFEARTIGILKNALKEMERGFQHLPAFESTFDEEGVEKVLMEVARRMGDNYPYHHPLYAGQMIKPPHPVAKAAYMLAMWINPNNHALDGGKASSAMEKEAVAALANMFGWKEHIGHLTSGGTVANLEALWIGSRLSPGKMVLASDQAHYTHSRLSDVLGLKFESVPSDDELRMDVDALRRIVAKGDVGLVVATIGTTGVGTVDPLPEILELGQEHGFWVHADAAYGGYFTLAGNLSPRTGQALGSLSEVDSLVVDPHKHGLQPYGCGCVLFHDPSVGRLYKHDSPYTYFTSRELHLGEISLECSRAGASAVALWATQRVLPMERGGEFAGGLEKGRDAALILYDKVSRDSRFLTVLPPELDILVFGMNGPSASQISERSERLFEAAERRGLFLAKFRLPSGKLRRRWKDVDFDRDDLVLLRSCLMKPAHLDWADRIWTILDDAAREVLVDQTLQY